MSEQQPKIMALSLYQPYASLIAVGAKRFETRTWGTKFRGQVIIHASKTLEYDWHDAKFVAAMKEAGIDNPAKLPLGAAIAVGELVGCYKTESVYPHISETERMFGNYDAGRVAWEFKDMKLFLAPVPVRGQQFLWEWKLPLPEYGVPF